MTPYEKALKEGYPLTRGDWLEQHMAEMQKKQIEAYIPHPRDTTLGEGEYYWADSADRVQRVRVREIMPGCIGESETYGCVYVSTGRRVRDYMGLYGNVHKGDLYDNKEDCRDRTHVAVEWWEQLREVQEEMDEKT